MNASSSSCSSWNSRFEELNEFFQVNGHYNVPLDCTDTEDLGIWVKEQRRSYRKESESAPLTESQVIKLKSICFPTEKDEEDRWRALFEDYINYPRKSLIQNRELAAWVKSQKEMFWQRTLGIERTIKLQNAAFDFQVDNGTIDPEWEAKFQDLKAFHVKHGHFCIPHMNGAAALASTKALSAWVIVQRNRAQRCVPTPMLQAEFDLLDEIGFEWTPNVLELWNKNFNKLMAFKKTHGHCALPADYKDEELCKWVTRQRELYARKEIDLQRFFKLQEAGFLWEDDGLGFMYGEEEILWMHIFGKLCDFQRENGHCFVPEKYETDWSLGAWVVIQRNQLQEGNLSPERKRMLDNIGFNWSEPPTVFNFELSQEDREWDEAYEKLLDYQQQHGTCNVPHDFEDQRLVHWVASQRGSQQRGSLIESRKRRLDGAGLNWWPIETSSRDNQPKAKKGRESKVRSSKKAASRQSRKIAAENDGTKTESETKPSHCLSIIPEHVPKAGSTSIIQKCIGSEDGRKSKKGQSHGFSDGLTEKEEQTAGARTKPSPFLRVVTEDSIRTSDPDNLLPEEGEVPTPLKGGNIFEIVKWKLSHRKLSVQELVACKRRNSARRNKNSAPESGADEVKSGGTINSVQDYSSMKASPASLYCESSASDTSTGDEVRRTASPALGGIENAASGAVADEGRKTDLLRTVSSIDSFSNAFWNQGGENTLQPSVCNENSASDIIEPKGHKNGLQPSILSVNSDSGMSEDKRSRSAKNDTRKNSLTRIHDCDCATETEKHASNLEEKPHTSGNREGKRVDVTTYGVHSEPIMSDSMLKETCVDTLPINVAASDKACVPQNKAIDVRNCGNGVGEAAPVVDVDVKLSGEVILDSEIVDETCANAFASPVFASYNNEAKRETSENTNQDEGVSETQYSESIGAVDVEQAVDKVCDIRSVPGIVIAQSRNEPSVDTREHIDNDCATVNEKDGLTRKGEMNAEANQSATSTIDQNETEVTEETKEVNSDKVRADIINSTAQTIKTRPDSYTLGSSAQEGQSKDEDVVETQLVSEEGSNGNAEETSSAAEHSVDASLCDDGDDSQGSKTGFHKCTDRETNQSSGQPSSCRVGTTRGPQDSVKTTLKKQALEKEKVETEDGTSIDKSIIGVEDQPGTSLYQSKTSTARAGSRRSSRGRNAKVSDIALEVAASPEISGEADKTLHVPIRKTSKGSGVGEWKTLLSPRDSSSQQVPTTRSTGKRSSVQAHMDALVTPSISLYDRLKSTASARRRKPIRSDDGAILPSPKQKRTRSTRTRRAGSPPDGRNHADADDSSVQIHDEEDKIGDGDPSPLVACNKREISRCTSPGHGIGDRAGQKRNHGVEEASLSGDIERFRLLPKDVRPTRSRSATNVSITDARSEGLSEGMEAAMSQKEKKTSSSKRLSVSKFDGRKNNKTNCEEEETLIEKSTADVKAGEQISVDAAPAIHTDFGQFQVGTKVAVYWTDDDTYYPGTVTRLDRRGKGALFVEYDDGDSEWTKLATTQVVPLQDEQETKRPARQSKRRKLTPRELEPPTPNESSVKVKRKRRESADAEKQDSGLKRTKHRQKYKNGDMVTVLSESEGNEKYVEGMVTRVSRDTKRLFVEYNDGCSNWIDVSSANISAAKQAITRSIAPAVLLPLSKFEDVLRRGAGRPGKKVDDEHLQSNHENDIKRSANLPQRRRGRPPKSQEFDDSSVNKRNSSKTTLGKGKEKPSTPKPDPDTENFQVGNMVDVYWSDDDAFYSGQVTKVAKGMRKIYVEYDDGDFEWISPSRTTIRLSDPDNNKKRCANPDLDKIKVGSRVSVWWPLEKKSFDATVVNVDGKRYFLEYDDGDSEYAFLGKRIFSLLDSEKPRRTRLAKKGRNTRKSRNSSSFARAMQPFSQKTIENESSDSSSSEEEALHDVATFNRKITKSSSSATTCIAEDRVKIGKGCFPCDGCYSYAKRRYPQRSSRKIKTSCNFTTMGCPDCGLAICVSCWESMKDRHHEIVKAEE